MIGRRRRAANPRLTRTGRHADSRDEAGRHDLRPDPRPATARRPTHYPRAAKAYGTAIFGIPAPRAGRGHVPPGSYVSRFKTHLYKKFCK